MGASSSVVLVHLLGQNVPSFLRWEVKPGPRGVECILCCLPIKELFPSRTEKMRRLAEFLGPRPAWHPLAANKSTSNLLTFNLYFKICPWRMFVMDLEVVNAIDCCLRTSFPGNLTPATWTFANAYVPTLMFFPDVSLPVWRQTVLFESCSPKKLLMLTRFEPSHTRTTTFWYQTYQQITAQDSWLVTASLSLPMWRHSLILDLWSLKKCPMMTQIRTHTHTLEHQQLSGITPTGLLHLVLNRNCPLEGVMCACVFVWEKDWRFEIWFFSWGGKWQLSCKGWGLKFWGRGRGKAVRLRCRKKGFQIDKW